MFSSALKTFQSNISANYTLSSSPTAISGAWKIFDGKKKGTGKAVSVFVFDRKSLEPHSGGLSRGSGGSSLRRLQDEVVARIKKEASMLARLRHPSILELAEPVEDTRSGGLMFATEPVTATLSGLLQDQDDQERYGGSSSRPSRVVVEDAEGQRRRKELELDELEIQKGLLQVAQGLEFLHESAGLVHGNLTPEAIFVNAKSDWKIGSFGFAGPPDQSNTQSNLTPISLSEVMYHDPRLPRSIQLDLDFTSPDFAMDSSVTTSADMFSLGILLIVLYNSPHTSPIKSNSNLSTYKKLFSSSSTTPSMSNNFLSTKPLPNELKSATLPRLITRRPASRMNAREFQQSAFFDNILVSSIRFLDTLPAKTPNEKSQFLRGLTNILGQFPKSVLDKKVLPALLDETKDKDLLNLILQNVFKIVKILPSSQRAMSDKILPHLREIFAAGNSKPVGEKDTAKEAGLAIVLQNVTLIGDNCGGKEFKDYMLPIILSAMDSSTHAIVDKALSCLPKVLSILDFSSIKNEVFPVVAAVFSKTSSLGIKVRGLEAFVILCGGSNDSSDIGDDLNGAKAGKASNSAVLDKYTVQEKIVPLLKVIKTKEPAVMMAALNVFKQVGSIADADFLAMDVLPILWSFSLGPLLNLDQFNAFMNLVKTLSSRIEQEQVRKLKEISSTSSRSMDQTISNDLMNVGSANGIANGQDDVGENDFERLVLGKKPGQPPNTDMLGDALQPQNQPAIPSQQPTLQWQRSASNISQRQHGNNSMSALKPQSRAITPDQTLSAFAPLSPATNTYNTTPPMTNGLNSFPTVQRQVPSAWPTLSAQQPQQLTPFQTVSSPPSLPQQGSAFNGFSIAPPPAINAGNNGMTGLANKPMGPTQNSFAGGMTNGSMQPQLTHPLQPQPYQMPQQQQKKSGLDAFESLL